MEESSNNIYNPINFSGKKSILFLVFSLIPGVIYSFILQSFIIFSYIFWLAFISIAIYIPKFTSNRIAKKLFYFIYIAKKVRVKEISTLDDLAEIIPLSIWQTNFNLEWKLFIKRIRDGIFTCYAITLSVWFFIIDFFDLSANPSFIIITILIFFFSPIVAFLILIPFWMVLDSLRKDDGELNTVGKKIKKKYSKLIISILAAFTLVISFLKTIDYYEFILKNPSSILYSLAFVIFNFVFISFYCAIYFSGVHEKFVNNFRNDIRNKTKKAILNQNKGNK